MHKAIVNNYLCLLTPPCFDNKVSSSSSSGSWWNAEVTSSWMQSAVNVAITPKCLTIQQADTRLFNYGRCIIMHHHTDYDVWLTFEQLPDDDTLVLKYVAFLRYKYVLTNYYYLSGCTMFPHPPAPIWQLYYLLSPVASVIPVFFH